MQTRRASCPIVVLNRKVRIGLRLLFVAVGATALVPVPAAQRTNDQQFRDLMETVAAGWNQGNSAKAANCFTEDAVYMEPPDKQVYVGRAALFEFFGGAKGPETSMHMQWHNLVFDDAQQIGMGEYTFEMHARYHGVVIVKLRDGKISHWREYQYPSALDFREFVGKSLFP